MLRLRQTEYFDAVRAFLTAAADRYEKTAPTVAAWCNDLYIRLDEAADRVSVSELLMVSRFVEDGVWMQPNYAANAVYHLQSRLGQDTTGQAGF